MRLFYKVNSPGLSQTTSRPPATPTHASTSTPIASRPATGPVNISEKDDEVVLVKVQKSRVSKRSKLTFTDTVDPAFSLVD